MEGKKVEQFYTPPPKLGKWEGFRVFLWNSETGQFLGRTGASWASANRLGKCYVGCLFLYKFFNKRKVRCYPLRLEDGNIQ
ncbi:unnamed protein product, partial [Heterotrigona itama]